ncbi:MAG: hypothetical protein WDO69_00485 [Pseudomonadota bacterium]
MAPGKFTSPAPAATPFGLPIPDLLDALALPVARVRDGIATQTLIRRVALN